MNPKKKKKEPPDPVFSVNLMLSVNCFQLYAICSIRSGLALPCSILGCSSLGHFSSLVTAHWSNRSLIVLAMKSSIAVKISVTMAMGVASYCYGRFSPLTSVSVFGFEALALRLLCVLSQDGKLDLIRVWVCITTYDFVCCSACVRSPSMCFLQISDLGERERPLLGCRSIADYRSSAWRVFLGLISSVSDGTSMVRVVIFFRSVMSRRLASDSYELLVVGGGFACYVRGRSLIHTSVPVIRSKGPRFAPVQSISPGRLFGSVSIASYYSFSLCTAQVCYYYLPLLFYLILMDYSRALCLYALRSIISGSSDWNGLLCFNWLWCCLRLSWLIGIEVTDGVTSWFYGWHFGDTKPHSLMCWELVRSVYGLVFTQIRRSRIARLLLNLFLIAPLASNCSTDWACILVSRLYYPYCMSSTILFEWRCVLLSSLIVGFCCLLLTPPPFMIGCDDRVHVAHPSAITLCSWDHVFRNVPFTEARNALASQQTRDCDARPSAGQFHFLVLVVFCHVLGPHDRLFLLPIVIDGCMLVIRNL